MDKPACQGIITVFLIFIFGPGLIYALNHLEKALVNRLPFSMPPILWDLIIISIGIFISLTIYRYLNRWVNRRFDKKPQENKS